MKRRAQAVERIGLRLTREMAARLDRVDAKLSRRRCGLMNISDTARRALDVGLAAIETEFDMEAAHA